MDGTRVPRVHWIGTFGKMYKDSKGKYFTYLSDPPKFGETHNMDFLIAAGITHDAFVPLHEVRKRITDIHNLFSLHRKWLPAGLRKRGDRMLASPDNAKALLSFLRQAARLEGSLIWSEKRQIMHADGKRRTSLYLYKLLN